MILLSLVITNFGVFKGCNELELRPRKHNGVPCPVVLFGGKNGVGKTTILEAIRLCLYGRSALGSRVRLRDYDTYIMQKIHRRSDSTPTPRHSASIGIVFEHTHAGIRSTYDAIRSWKVSRGKVKESISIYKDGYVLKEVTPEHWNDFLRDLIPPGVADLFFFDGEQIQALADGESEAVTLGAAIRGLLNLDLVEQLQSDLSIYLRQHQARDNPKIPKTIENLEDEREAIRANILEFRQDRAQLNSHLDRTVNQIERVRQEAIRQGAPFIRNRDTIEDRLQEVELEIEKVTGKIREMAAGLLPFALVPQWNAKLKERLQCEADAEEARSAFVAQQAHVERAIQRFSDPKFQQDVAPSIDDKEWQRLITEIEETIRPQQPQPTTIRHPVSSQNRTILYGWIDQSIHNIPQLSHELAQQLERFEDEYQQLQRALDQVPEEEVAHPLVEEFLRLLEKRTNLLEQMRKADSIIRELDLQLGDIDRELAKARKRRQALQNLELRVGRAIKVQTVLDEYLKQITEVKVRELEQTIARYFNLLSRKKRLVSEVVVNPKTFEVGLFEENRKALPKSDLSAGEKQLYAMSLLWALRSVSGRALPIVMDTPMSRLDSDHRSALLEYFFPSAAHQVILLSTDTEIDSEAFDALKPHVSHAFQLEFDEDAGYTRIRNGYSSDEGVIA